MVRLEHSRGLDAIGVGATETISILQAIKAAGASNVGLLGTEPTMREEYLKQQREMEEKAAVVAVQTVVARWNISKSQRSPLRPPRRKCYSETTRTQVH